MNRILLALAGGIMLFASCKENNPPIFFTKSVDSTFIASPIPAVDSHNVLIEEFTGQSCSNCPAAHTKLENIAKLHASGRINTMGLYLYDNPQSVPPSGYKNDLRDSTAFQISKSVYNGVNSLPSGGVDRIAIGAGLALTSGQWGDAIDAQLAVANPLNLQVKSSFNTTTNEATITATVIYTQTVTVPQNISIVVTEDSIIDYQEFPGSTGVVTNYVFTNVFRGMVTSPPFGDPVLPKLTTKPAGQGWQINYTYKPKTILPPASAIDPKHCRVIAFINTNNGTDYHVVQSAQCRLAP